MSIIPSPPTSNTVEFVNFGNAPDNVDWNLFMVPTTESVTFSSNLVGSFFCGEGFTSSDLSGFCTEPLNSNSDTNSADFLTSVAGPGSGQLTFNFISGATDLPAEWVFYADTSEKVSIVGSTATPEPPTIALVAVGLLALFGAKGFRRLRFQN
jgi:hypothetical protein